MVGATSPRSLMARHFSRMRPVLLAGLLACLAGCQRASPYGAHPDAVAQPPSYTNDGKRAGEPISRAPLDAGLQWLDRPHPREPVAGVPIEFVHVEKSPAEWSKLEKLWNEPPLTRPAGAVALMNLWPPAAASMLAGQKAAVRIKVPLGLPDPSEFHPAGSSLTLEQWQLGRKLFFDTDYLQAERKESCASCHQPDHGFADTRRTHDGHNTPSLLNCVFNRHQFWDGRARLLEEVVQRSLEDERTPAEPGPFRHVWHGVIERLRKSPAYCEQFEKTFGCLPTQDTVGRALAAYLRTLLSGNSLYDRAVQVQRKRKAAELEASDFLAVLTARDLGELEREDAKKERAADELARGWRLFQGLDAKRETHCSHCHTGATFSDGRFHNLGVGFQPPDPQQIPPGRFAHVPVGEKDRYLIEAYKTPSLRGLLRSGPYFHNGEMEKLAEVVQFYNEGGKSNDYQDPELHSASERTLQLHLSSPESAALVLFLRALNGEEIEESVRRPPPPP